MPDAFLASLSQTPEEVAWFLSSHTAQSFWRSNGSTGISVRVLRRDFTSLGITHAQTSLLNQKKQDRVLRDKPPWPPDGPERPERFAGGGDTLQKTDRVACRRTYSVGFWIVECPPNRRANTSQPTPLPLPRRFRP